MNLLCNIHTRTLVKKPGGPHAQIRLHFVRFIPYLCAHIYTQTHTWVNSTCLPKKWQQSKKKINCIYVPYALLLLSACYVEFRAMRRLYCVKYANSVEDAVHFSCMLACNSVLIVILKTQFPPKIWNYYNYSVTYNSYNFWQLIIHK